jgi:hypothetical protein
VADIRPELKRRLDAITKEREAIQSRLIELDNAESSINSLLEWEEHGVSTATPTRPRIRRAASKDADQEHDNGWRTPLGSFIMTTAQQAGRRWLSLEGFKAAAKDQLNFGKQSPGRTIHRALLGLTANGYLECQGSGKEREYRLKKE